MTIVLTTIPNPNPNLKRQRQTLTIREPNPRHTGNAICSVISMAIGLANSADNPNW